MSQATSSVDGRGLLDGVTVPLVTPIDRAGRPDPAAAGQHLASLAASGVNKLLLLGTNGEGCAFDAAECAEFATTVGGLWRDFTSGVTVVSVAVFGSSTRETMRRAEALLGCGADALVVAPPHYFRYQDNELTAFYRDVAALPMPIVVYNAARYTGNPITEVVLGEVANTPNIVGIKDSGGDDGLLLAAVRIAQAQPHFAVSQGNERRLAWALQEGAVGVTPGLANIAPRACLRLVDAVRNGQTQAAESLQADLDSLSRMHGIRPGVASMKAALTILGVSASPPAAPAMPYSNDERKALRALLATTPVELIEPLPIEDEASGR